MNGKHILTLLILAIVCIGYTGSACASDVDNAIENALRYLAEHQQPDGGFAEPGVSGSQTSPTWFAVTAITSVGDDPADWNVGGVSSRDFWKTEQSGSDGTGEVAKMCCILVQYGLDPHNYQGKNYVEELKNKMKPNGQIGDFVYTTYWGIFGLVAAGEDVSKSVAWLKSQQQADGGWSWVEGAVSDSDDTAASIMALIAGGVSPDDQSIKNAVQYLRNVQEPSGGFNYGYYSESNLASTAWVVQALCAAGIDPETVTTNGNSPIDYLLSLQQADGSFKYTAYTTDSPVSMTARAVAALSGKPYPILPDGYVPIGSTSSIDTPTEAAISPLSPIALTALLLGAVLLRWRHKNEP